MKRILTAVVLIAIASMAYAKTQILQSGGWFESCYVEWNNESSIYNNYNVYVCSENDITKNAWTQLDKELVRNYGSYGRADALGLKAGKYYLKVVPVPNSSSTKVEPLITPLLEVKAHDRTGFAHQNHNGSGAALKGVGAYNDDGTLKADAQVLYVTANNAKTITADLMYGTSKKTYTGLNTIINGYKSCIAQGGKQPPLCIRIIGLLKAENMDKVSGKGIAISGNGNYFEMPLTLEGVGNDATIHGLGIGVGHCTSIEIRNLGIMLCPDDAIEVATYNSNVWIHNNDIFYGKTGIDADQVKGDGSIDIKQSQYCTVSYNHFFDCGKCSLLDAGAKSSDYVDNLTYHHNWFDHSDQRNPRCRNGHAFHIYNNLYDGNALYGVGMACGSSSFVECNYFRNTKFPVLSSAQGSDKQWKDEGLITNPELVSKGFLSGENGGICKWYSNIVINPNSLYTQKNAKAAYSFDVYEVGTRTEQIPSTVKTLKSATPYSNFDTGSKMYASTPDKAQDVPSIVMGEYGAGRMQHGDFVWQFDNSKEDESEELIVALKEDMTNYKSCLVGFYGESIKNGGGNGNSGGDKEKNADYLPSWGATTGIGNMLSNSLDDSHTDDAIYNLAGQRISAPQKGVYIRKIKRLKK